MNWSEPSFVSPATALAWDEAFLQALAATEPESGGGSGMLWFWESPVPFVVIGYGQRREREVDLPACARRGVPVLRRCSGGGAVVQGPGCLNYGLALRVGPDGPLSTIGGANAWIMARQRRALTAVLERPVTVAGYTDLVLDGRKFSGNAQRRLRGALLFHGTLLLGFDLAMIPELLPRPSLEPDYRAGRSHLDFVTNLPVPAAEVKSALRTEWGAVDGPVEPPAGRVADLLASRYGRAEFHAAR